MEAVLNIRSPSQTKLFDRCRFKWYLEKKLGVVKKYIEKKDLAAAVGGGIGSALAMYYNQRNAGQEMSLDEVKAIASESYAVRLQEEIDKGREFVETPESVKYPGLISNMIEAYWKKPGVPTEWSVQGTEYQCDEDNRSFIDVWGYNDRGSWLIDWKCKMSCKPYQVTGELTKYQKSWQLGHYVWSLKRHLGEWPKTAGISLIIGEPTASSKYLDFEVDEDYMSWWEASAIRIWDEMDRAEAWLEANPTATIQEVQRHLGMATEHMDGIFKCDMTDLCFLYGGDPSVAEPFIQVEKT